MVRPHTTSPEEIAVHLAVVERNVKDASVEALSDDGRFLMAYQAAFQLATMVLFAAGYEPLGDDHHKTTFAAVPVAMGDKLTFLTDYFDLCRRKRNNLQYDQVNVATASEAKELRAKVGEFRTLVLEWLGQNHPKLLAKVGE